MANLTITLVLGHPLAKVPVVSASAPVATADATQHWTIATPPGTQPPGPLTPPVIT